MLDRTKNTDENLLNKCTEELLLCLPEHAGELIHEIAKDYNLPIWQIVCGLVLEMHVQGNLSNFYLDPAWADGIKQYDYTCMLCNKTFKPKHLGQKFCSNECGNSFNEGKVKRDVITNISTTPATDSSDLIDKISRVIKETDSGWGKGESVPIE